MKPVKSDEFYYGVKKGGVPTMLVHRLFRIRAVSKYDTIKFI